ncbi:hypothetical protein QH73_0019490 [Scytonema millei VB511283]|uniref:Uncharacterized protein n=1 Tax=Scytonema millei VB511283 TaxID=1245923 RepID=A0A9X5I653_9CYAN|nr:hypothetical protein [Scytonema millei VB511283]
MNIFAHSSHFTPQSGGEFDPQRLKVQPFVDPDPFQELTYPTVIAAKQAIAEYLARPLAKLTPGQIAYINATLDSTLNKQVVMEKIRDFFNPLPGSHHAE